MILKKLIVLFTFVCTITINAQIISQFSWDSNPVTTADVGPNATSVSASATSSAGGVGGTNGLNAGLPKLDLDFVIPTAGGIFDSSGIDVSFDFQRDEGSGNFFTRGNSLIIMGSTNLSVTYRVDNGGGFTTINSGNVYAIPNDATYRNYRFYYLASTGYGAILVDNVEVWNNDGPDNQGMYWTGAGDITIGDGLDGSGSNRAFLDNLIIASISIAPLPIKLIDFTAKIVNNNSVKLEWQTSSEINNDFFTIERSTNGLDWEIVKTIDGAGNSSSILSYSSIDGEPYSETSYYRLKQTDFDGQFEYSQIRSVTIKKLEKSQIEIYPNPVNNQLTIEGDKTELKEIIIYNLLGQDVTGLTKQIMTNGSKLVIDLSNLNTGMYCIKTKTTSTKVYKN